MDYERKYKEALERAKSFELQEYKNIMASVFPELRESEDERISREITKFILTHRIDEPNDIEDTNSWLVWLEKQAPKSKWTEEDEELYQDALDAFEALANDLNPSEDWSKLYDWLKSLKQRMEE